MPDPEPFVLERRFDAPPEVVWTAWTDDAHQARWYGPGVTTIVHRNDLRADGQWLVEMRGEGWSALQRADFVSVDPPKRLSFLQGTADDDWNIVRNPQIPDFPLVMRMEVSFAEAPGGKTDMRLVWEPHNPTEAEAAFFATAIDAMGQGWNMGMDALDQVLAELREGGQSG